MAFRNPAIAGLYLVRPALQSPNYVAGSTGWTINRDGSSEFNAGVYRGSITAGPNPGKHFVVNNPTTGDVIDVYNTSNQLVFSVDGNGVATSYDPVNVFNVQMQNAGIAFHDTNGLTGFAVAQSEGNVGTNRQCVAGFAASGHSSGMTNELQLFAGSDDGTIPAYTLLIERNATVSPVVTDTIRTNNQFHAASYSGTTNASGHVIFNHGCAFTPTGGVVTGTAPGGTFANLTYGISSFNATQGNVNWTVANTSAAFANSIITFDMILWG